MLYKLRYRMSVGVREDLIDAKDQEQADLVGRTYCGVEPGRVFIKCSPAVVATAALLKAEQTQTAARVGA